MQREMDQSLKTIAMVVFAALISACTQPTASTSESSTAGNEVYEAGPTERAYCTSSTYSGASVTITGQATYHARAVIDNGDGTGGLGGAPGTAFPIRYAEVEVLDSTGRTSQCGETDGNGNFSIVLPQDQGSYQIQVHSRSPANDANVLV